MTLVYLSINLPSCTKSATPDYIDGPPAILCFLRFLNFYMLIVKVETHASTNDKYASHCRIKIEL